MNRRSTIDEKDDERKITWNLIVVPIIDSLVVILRVILMFNQSILPTDHSVSPLALMTSSTNIRQTLTAALPIIRKKLSTIQNKLAALIVVPIMKFQYYAVLNALIMLS